MKFLFLMTCVTIAYSAPINEEHLGGTAEDMDHSIAKRTEEQIFFGNQQNAPRVKKADQETDPKGLVRALPAELLNEEKETPLALVENVETEPKEDSEVEEKIVELPGGGIEKVVEKEELLPGGGIEKVVEKEDLLPGGGIEKVVENEELIEPNETYKDNSEEVLEKEGQLEAEPPVDSPLTSEESEGGDGNDGSGDVDESSEEMTYDYLQKLYNQAENREQYPNDYYYSDYYLNYRKKRAADEGEDVVKRNHRTKRDLGYGDISESYFPETFAENRFYNDALRKRAVQEALDEAVAEELAPLLDNYEAQEAGNSDRYDNSRYLEYFPVSPDSYERYPYDDIWDSDEDFGSLSRPSADQPYKTLFRSQPTSFLPIKRQAMSFVPGIRRRSFNYPHSMEPGSHWGAFVETEKREEEAAYERLYRLAQALAKRSPYAPYWEEDEYKKK